MGIRVETYESHPEVNFPADLPRTEEKELQEVKPEKRVRFACVITYEEEHFLEEEDMAILWFTEEELGERHSELIDLINCEDKSESEESMRGLELASNKHQQAAVRAVHDILLDLQEDNRCKGYPDCKGMDKLSLRLTRHDVREAGLRAAQDAIEANRIYKETIEASFVDQCFW
jgi:hypothetical protein